MDNITPMAVSNVAATTTFVPSKTLTLDEIKRLEKQRQENKMLPVGNFVAVVLQATFSEQDGQFLCLFRVQIPNADGGIETKDYRETFFFEEKKNYSKLGLLTEFMQSVGMRDLTDESVAAIMGKKVLLQVTRTPDAKKPDKFYTNISNYAPHLDLESV